MALRIQGKIGEWEHGSLLSDLPLAYQEQLRSHGYIYEDGAVEAPSSSGGSDEILKGSVSEVKSQVEALDDLALLERLRYLEEEGKSRKGALRAIKNRIEVLNDGSD